jgi:murein L,D-transpeptidase YafK
MSCKLMCGSTLFLLVIVAGCSRSSSLTPTGPPGNSLHVVDQVIVHKAQRRLLLMHGGEIVRSYPVKLGLMPSGQKDRAGDNKTPEGSYQLGRRNPQSDYFLSIDVSYPNQSDLERARQHHWDPGGAIEIHGQPIHPSHDSNYYSHDWTDGCIAVANADMAEIWTLIPENVSIEITP